MRLVDDLASEDRVSVLRVHLHPFEGYSVPFAQLASHHYPVDCPCALAHRLFTAALHIFSVSERSAQQDGSSSTTGTFPLGEYVGKVRRGPWREPPQRQHRARRPRACGRLI